MVTQTSLNLTAFSDILRQYQAAQLYKDHKLVNLHIYHSKISKSFGNQVLATSVTLIFYPEFSTDLRAGLILRKPNHCSSSFMIRKQLSQASRQ